MISTGRNILEITKLKLFQLPESYKTKYMMVPKTIRIGKSYATLKRSIFYFVRNYGAFLDPQVETHPSRTPPT